MQENNTDNNENNGAKDSSDEILDILNNYRKTHSQPEQTASTVKKQADSNADTIIIENDSNRNANNVAAESADITGDVMSHFSNGAHHGQTSSESDSVEADSVSSHFSDSADKRELQKAQKSSKETRLQKEKKPKKITSAVGKSSLLFKALFYILFVVIISAYLSYYIITVGNDVFALVKDDQETYITLSENATMDDVVTQLEQKRVISYPWAFKLYLNYRSKKSFEFISGEHKLNSNMNYTQIIQELTTLFTERKPVRIVVPEGYTVDQIIDLLVKNGIGSREKYVDAINNYPYKHEFIQELNKLGYSKDRKYRLEGYLYPDTYDFYNDTDEVHIINKFLNNFDTKFWNDYKTQYIDICNKYKMNFDQLIILSSMIQAEGNNPVDFEYISYVFHNRLNRGGEFLKLQSDATIQYILSVRREDLTEADTKIDNPYNTYQIKGFPPGAICNPGLDAISAALSPVKPVNENGVEINAYFFVSNKAGQTYYANDKSGHDKNIARVKAENKALETTSK